MNNNVLEKIEICKNKKLLYLDLSKMGLNEIPKELKDLPWLERLSISNNNIEDISILQYLPNLHKLAFSNNRIEDLSPLLTNKRLKFLFMKNNLVKDISPLCKLKTLKKIEANNNKISNIGSIEELKENLVFLDFENNNLKNAKNIQSLSNLRWLNLKGNGISKDEIKSIKEALKHLRFFIY